MSQTMVDTETLKAAVQLACRAPSYHNSQPWRWIAGASALDLRLDAGRVVRSDPSGRQALISCGAVLDHLVAAMAAAGWTANVDRYPNPNDHHHLAAVDFTALSYVTDGHRRRAEAIRRRRTDRLPLAAPVHWASFEATLRRAVGDTAIVDVPGDAVRPALFEAVALAEAARLYDSVYSAELDRWTSSFDVVSGIPHSSLVSAAESDRVPLGRRFPVADHPAQRTAITEDHAAIVVLSAYNNTQLDVLRCGEALSAALLSATMAGLASCTLTHLTEVRASCEVVTALTGRELPLMLIRIGTAPTQEGLSAPTPRRPLVEVLTISR